MKGAITIEWFRGYFSDKEIKGNAAIDKRDITPQKIGALLRRLGWTENREWDGTRRVRIWCRGPKADPSTAFAPLSLDPGNTTGIEDPDEPDGERLVHYGESETEDDSVPTPCTPDIN